MWQTQDKRIISFSKNLLDWKLFFYCNYIKLEIKAFYNAFALVAAIKTYAFTLGGLPL